MQFLKIIVGLMIETVCFTERVGYREGIRKIRLPAGVEVRNLITVVTKERRCE